MDRHKNVSPQVSERTSHTRDRSAEKPKPRGPSELERVETAIASQEEAVAELERKLAEDWTNVETLQAHRRAREELQSLLDRWETAFEKQQA